MNDKKKKGTTKKASNKAFPVRVDNGIRDKEDEKRKWQVVHDSCSLGRDFLRNNAK